jgi:hypothetical protein
VAGSFRIAPTSLSFLDTHAKAQSVDKNSHLTLGSSNYQLLTALFVLKGN